MREYLVIVYDLLFTICDLKFSSLIALSLSQVDLDRKD